MKYINARLGLSKYRVFLKTDSMYSINCVTKWVNGWMNNGWKTKSGSPVSNKDLIEPIYKYYSRYNIILEHVDAHTGDDDYDSIGNEKADKLATNATKKAQLNEKANKAPSRQKPKIPRKRPARRAPSGSKTSIPRKKTVPKKRQPITSMEDNVIVELIHNSK